MKNKTFEKFLKKYRKQIIENLYKEEGYRFDRVSRIYDEKTEVIFLIYVRERK